MDVAFRPLTFVLLFVPGVVPLALGRVHELEHLRALHRRENLDKGGMRLVGDLEEIGSAPVTGEVFDVPKNNHIARIRSRRHRAQAQATRQFRR